MLCCYIFNFKLNRIELNVYYRKNSQLVWPFWEAHIIHLFDIRIRIWRTNIKKARYSFWESVDFGSYSYCRSFYYTYSSERERNRWWTKSKQSSFLVCKHITICIWRNSLHLFSILFQKYRYLYHVAIPFYTCSCLHCQWIFQKTLYPT
jgi:hypothetical protein